MGWQRTDDLDGTSPAQLVTFGLDGKAYMLDLAEREHQKLHTALQRFITVAAVYATMPEPPRGPEEVKLEMVVEPLPVPPREPIDRKDVSTKVVRAWANNNGYTLGPKGRVPEAIITHYLHFQQQGGL